MLYSQAVEEFLIYLRITDKSNETIIGYKKELSYMNRFLVSRYNCPIYLGDIVLEDIEAYLFYKVEAALVEYLQSYGYRSEVESILGNKLC